MTLGIKKCTIGRTRSLAYSLFYSMLISGLFLAGPVVDIIRNFVGKTTIYIADGVYEFSPYRMVFFIGFCLSFIGFWLIFFLYKEVDLEEGLGLDRSHISNN